MLPGVYSPGAVIDARLRIFVDGIEREHVSAEWEGHTSGGLPESLIAAGDGVFSRTGRIKWGGGHCYYGGSFCPCGGDPLGSEAWRLSENCRRSQW